jgi:hypothetical protein
MTAYWGCCGHLKPEHKADCREPLPGQYASKPDDLVERLSVVSSEAGYGSVSYWMSSALDEKQRAERAEAERDTIRQINNGWAAECEKLEEERDRMRSERDAEAVMADLVAKERDDLRNIIEVAKIMRQKMAAIDAARKEGK